MKRLAGPWVWALALTGCAAAPPAGAPASTAGAPLDGSGTTAAGEPFELAALRGRATAVLFVTTYDPASQVAARRLEELLRRLRPRANAVAVVLEAPRYAPLAQVFAETLELSYPVVMASPSLLEGTSALGTVGVVPVLVVLDRRGVPRAQWVGLAPPREVERALRSASAGADPAR